MCCAIITSSSFRMTRTDTRLSAVEIALPIWNMIARYSDYPSNFLI